MDGIADDYEADKASQTPTEVGRAPTGPPDWMAKRDADEARFYHQSAAAFAARADGLAIVDQLALLRAADLITDAEAAAGERWRIDWMLYAHGVIDSDSTGKACDHQQATPSQRVKAGDRCRYVRDGIGIISERLLVMTIIEGNSATAIGAKLYRHMPDTAARDKAHDICHAAIQALAERYRALDTRPSSSA